MTTKIPEFVKRLETALNGLDWLGRTVRPTMRPPATKEQIGSLEKRFGRELPPSYREFLKIADGMEGADQYDWAIGGCTPVKRGESFDDVKAGHEIAFKQRDEAHPVVTDLPQTHVVGSDFDYQVVYFDVASKGDEEPKLRRVGVDGEYDDYPLFENFTEFLEFLVQIYEDLVELQNAPMPGGAGDDFDFGDFGGGGGGGGGGKISNDDLEMLTQLSNLFDDRDAEEKEEEPPLSPEMALASRMCSHVIDKLIQAELVEVMEGQGHRENLEDYLLRKLIRTTREDRIFDAWIGALTKAREVEEVFGTDDELKRVMEVAWNEIAEEQENAQ